MERPTARKIRRLAKLVSGKGRPKKTVYAECWFTKRHTPSRVKSQEEIDGICT